MNYLCFKQDKCILMSTAAILEFYELKRKEKNTLKNMVKVLRNKKKIGFVVCSKGGSFTGFCLDLDFIIINNNNNFLYVFNHACFRLSRINRGVNLLF